MISFLIHKMWKNKWMMLCLIIGNILLVGIVSGTPMYVNATLMRILHQDLRQYQAENNIHPALISLRYDFNAIAADNRETGYLQTRDNFVPGLLRDLGVPAIDTLRVDTLSFWQMLPSPPREVNPRVRSVQLTGTTDMTEHVYITQGRLPSDTLVNGNIIEALAMEATMRRHDVIMGELLEARNVTSHPTGTIYVQIVGIYTPAEGSEQYWAALDLNHINTFLVSDTLVQNYFMANYHTDYRLLTTWIHLLDYTAMTSRHVPQYLEALANMRDMFTTGTLIWAFSENFSETIIQHIPRADMLEITLWVLQIPIYVLLAAYIYIVSRQILKLEQNDISVIKSRGASRWQILRLYGMQGLFVAMVCYPIGIALGVALCRMLGASSGFLYLVQRAALVVEITPTALLYAGLAMFLSFLTMFLPVIGFSRVTIVTHKRSKTGKIKKPLWQRFFLDILCLGVAGYGLFTFNNQRDMLALMVRDTNAVDPLIFASSSLFIIGLGLLALRLFPYVMKLVYTLGRRFWPPSVYASLLKVMRSAGDEQFIMIFLIFTLSVGTFSAQTARTINLNNDHQINYLAGADLMFREFWVTGLPPAAMGGGAVAATEIVFHEPSFERFTNFPEVDSITQVKVQDAQVRAGGAAASTVTDVTLMAVETDTFGETIWFRGDLLEAHVNHFLNVLASRADGVLLSESFREMGFRLGDRINYANSIGNVTSGIVMGFVEHWPGFIPMARHYQDGQVWELMQHLIVANIGHLQTIWGVQPYQVWMNTNTESNAFIHDFIHENRLHIVEFHDANATVIESRSDPMLQGINGVLTVGFIVTLLICFTGFLIYWILSIRSRVLQFGIFRAMGMEMRGLIGILVNEQIFITLTAVALGAAVGEIAARLFVPLIQISYTAADQVIPLMIVSELRDYANLYMVIGTMIVLCLIVLAVYISRIKIAQALKLGED